MITIQNLTRCFGDFTAVDDVSFTINKNEIVAMLGVNGAGKTTTLRMLTGFLPSTSGNISINNFNLTDQPMYFKQQIGYMPENPALYHDMKVKDFLTYLYRLRLYTKEGEEAAVDLAMKKTNIEDRRDDFIGTLSAGFKKRIGLAQAIVHNPNVLIFDEPISDLDPVQIVEIRNLLVSLKADHTILISSHILSEVAQVADRYLFLHEGKLVAEETPKSMSKYMTNQFEYIVEVNLRSDDKTALIKSLESESKSSITIKSEEDSILKFIVKTNEDIRNKISKIVIESGNDLLGIQKSDFGIEKLFIKVLTQSSNKN